MHSTYENNNPVENNRLIPKIDDNGSITDVLLLASNQQYRFGVFKIIDNDDELKKIIEEDQS